MQGNSSMIVQSGGSTVVINNSLIGIIDGISSTPITGEIYGAVGGLYELLHEELKENGYSNLSTGHFKKISHIRKRLNRN